MVDRALNGMGPLVRIRTRLRPIGVERREVGPVPRVGIDDQHRPAVEPGAEWPIAPAVPSGRSSSIETWTRGRSARCSCIWSRPWWAFTATDPVTVASASSDQSSSGRPPTGHNGLGVLTVIGRSRVPAPAASATPATSSAATLSPMSQTRWFNPRLPQTLVISQFLLYFDAFFALLGALGVTVDLGFRIGGLARLLSLASLAAFIYGAYGIANERKRGYQVAVAVVRTVGDPLRRGLPGRREPSGNLGSCSSGATSSTLCSSTHSSRCCSTSSPGSTSASGSPDDRSGPRPVTATIMPGWSWK